MYTLVSCIHLSLKLLRAIRPNKDTSLGSAETRMKTMLGITKKNKKLPKS